MEPHIKIFVTVIHVRHEFQQVHFSLVEFFAFLSLKAFVGTARVGQAAVA